MHTHLDMGMRERVGISPWIQTTYLGLMLSLLVHAACFLVPDVDARGNTVTHEFILVPATGPYIQQRGCASALYYLTPGVLVVGGTSEAREGGRLPSLC